MRLFIHPFIHLFIHSFIYSFINSCLLSNKQYENLYIALWDLLTPDAKCDLLIVVVLSCATGGLEVSLKVWWTVSWLAKNRERHHVPGLYHRSGPVREETTERKSRQNGPLVQTNQIGRAECVRCPWLLAQTKVATILGIFPLLVLVLLLILLAFTPEGIVVWF